MMVWIVVSVVGVLLSVVGVLFGVATVVPLLFRRRFPFVALAAVFAAAVASPVDA